MRRQKAQFRQAGTPSSGADLDLDPRHPAPGRTSGPGRCVGWLLVLGALTAWPADGGALAQNEGPEAPAVYVNEELLERLTRGPGGTTAATAPEPDADLRLAPSGQLNSRLYVSPGQPAAPAQAPPAPEILAGELKALSDQSTRRTPPLPRRKAELPELPAEARAAAEGAPEAAKQTAGESALAEAEPRKAARDSLATDTGMPDPADLAREVPPAVEPTPTVPEQAASESADAAPAPAELTREVPAATDPVVAVVPSSAEPEPEAPPRTLDPGTTPPVAAAPERTGSASETAAPADAPKVLTEEIPAPPQAEAPPAEATADPASEARDQAPETAPQPSEILSALEQESEAAGKGPGTPPAPAVPDPPAPPEPAETAASFDSAPPPPPPSTLPSDDQEAGAPPPRPAPEAQLGAAEPAPQTEPAQVAELTEGLEVLDQTRLLFEAGSTELSPEARAQLDRLAELLKDAESDSLLLRAYASGRDARRLSLNRALVARAYLETQGISSKRVVLRPLGDKAVEGSTDRVDIERLRR